MYHDSRVVVVVAIGKNKELGNANTLLWHLPNDLKRFRDLTRGHPVVMGRKTFDSILSILGKPLPNRTNIVITREPSNVLAAPNVIAVTSLEEGLLHASKAEGGDEIHIGGGAQIYELALPYVDTLHLTVVDDAPQADTFFPSYEHLFPSCVSRESHEENGMKYQWVTVQK